MPRRITGPRACASIYDRKYPGFSFPSAIGRVFRALFFPAGIFEFAAVFNLLGNDLNARRAIMGVTLIEFRAGVNKCAKSAIDARAGALLFYKLISRIECMNTRSALRANRSAGNNAPAFCAATAPREY